MIEYIGGFFELDEFKNGNGPYHHEGLALTNGRACFHAILREISPSHLYLPYYCCDSLLYVIHEHNISFSFYSINSNFEMTSPPALKSTEWLLYINYFGLKTDYIQSIYDQYSGLLLLIMFNLFETSFNQSWSLIRLSFWGAGWHLSIFSSTLTIDTKPPAKISMAHLIHVYLANKRLHLKNSKDLNLHFLQTSVLCQIYLKKYYQLFHIITLCNIDGTCFSTYIML